MVVRFEVCVAIENLGSRKVNREVEVGKKLGTVELVSLNFPCEIPAILSWLCAKVFVPSNAQPDIGWKDESANLGSYRESDCGSSVALDLTGSLCNLHCGHASSYKHGHFASKH